MYPKFDCAIIVQLLCNYAGRDSKIQETSYHRGILKRSKGKADLSDMLQGFRKQLRNDWMITMVEKGHINSGGVQELNSENRWKNPFGDGNAGKRIVKLLVEVQGWGFKVQG